MLLTSVNNPKVKEWQKLKLKKYRSSTKSFLIEDDHLINEALKSNLVKEIITLNPDEKYLVPTFYVNDKIMHLLSNQESGAQKLAVVNFLPSREIKGNILILDNLQDPGNLGTIIRSAVAFNFDTIFLSTDTVDLYNPKTIRSSEGMIFHLNILKGDIIEFLNKLDKSYTIVTTNVVKGENIHNLSTISKWALIIGNEGHGVSKEVQDVSQKFVKIPMNSNCESLNAAISASILMYEINNLLQ